MFLYRLHPVCSFSTLRDVIIILLHSLTISLLLSSILVKIQKIHHLNVLCMNVYTLETSASPVKNHKCDLSLKTGFSCGVRVCSGRSGYVEKLQNMYGGLKEDKAQLDRFKYWQPLLMPVFKEVCSSTTNIIYDRRFILFAVI